MSAGKHISNRIDGLLGRWDANSHTVSESKEPVVEASGAEAGFIEYDKPKDAKKFMAAFRMDARPDSIKLSDYKVDLVALAGDLENEEFKGATAEDVADFIDEIESMRQKFESEEFEDAPQLTESIGDDWESVPSSSVPWSQKVIGSRDEWEEIRHRVERKLGRPATSIGVSGDPTWSNNRKAGKYSDDGWYWGESDEDGSVPDGPYVVMGGRPAVVAGYTSLLRKIGLMN